MTSMFVDPAIVSAAANLIAASLDDLPVEADAEWHDFTAEEADLERDLIDELTWSDLMLALNEAARRLAARSSRES